MEFVNDDYARDTGGGEFQNSPGQEKSTTEPEGLAEHDVLLGGLFMEIYNRHRHTDVLPEPLASGQSIESEGLAEHGILLGDFFMEIFNRHRHAG